jgi:hypothetical protein
VSAEITAAPSPTLRCPATFSPKYIKRAWELIARDGAPREVRILKTEKDGTVSGIFTDPKQVAAAIASWDGVKSIYLTVNPLKPEMLARENVGKLARWTKDTTADHDIASREWLIIDVDPMTPVKHVSATEEEQALAIEVRDRLAEWLTEEFGFPAPIRGRSGNGGRLLYAIELPNDEASTDLIKRCLQALALHWNVPKQVEIDTSVYNASRVDKVWGTMAVKGSSTDERPHRRAYLDVVPAEILLLLREQLDQLAALVPAKPTRQVRASVDAGRDFPELLAAIRAQGLYLKQVGSDHFITCPWKSEHTVESGASETKLFEPSIDNEYAGGFRCQHSHCTERRIADVYALFIAPTSKPSSSSSSSSGAKRPPVTWRSGTELDDTPITYLVEGLVPTGWLGAIAGRDGRGKTLLGMEIARCVLTGEKLFGQFAAQQGNVFLMLLDDPENLVRERLDAFGITDHPNLKVATAKDVDLADKPAMLEYLKETLPPLDPTWVMIDALYHFFPGSGSGGQDQANNASAMGPVMKVFDELANAIKGTLALVAHDNKAGSDIAGSQIIRNQLKWILRLVLPDEFEKKREEGALTDQRVLQLNKLKTGRNTSWHLKVGPPGQWTFQGDSAAYRRASLPDRILARVFDHGGYTVEDLAKAIKARENEVRAACVQLHLDGKLARIERPRTDGKKGRATVIYDYADPTLRVGGPSE